MSQLALVQISWYRVENSLCQLMGQPQGVPGENEQDYVRGLQERLKDAYEETREDLKQNAVRHKKIMV